MTLSTKDLNFKVDPIFHQRFKTAATSSGLTMRQLLERSFTAFLLQEGRTNG